MVSNRKINMLIFFFRDKNKKKWRQIIKEFTVLFIEKKKVPLYYISSLLYRENVNNYKDYLSLEEGNKLLSWSYSHGKEEIVLTENKLLFEELLVKNNIATPQIFFHNSKNKFAYKGRFLEIENKTDFISFLALFFKESNISRLFCKPKAGIKGQDIFIIDKTTYKSIDDSLVNALLSQDFIFQEVIQQHKSLNRINPSCINSLRIVTYKNEANQVEILAATVRLGRSGSIVDNTHAGGMVVGLNINNGKLKREGLQLIDNGGGIFYKHPETEVVFENFQIPFLNEVKKILTEASKLFKLPLLGWDVAITPEGPVLIEVNHNFFILFSDRFENGLKNNPVFNKLYKQVIEGQSQ